MYKTSLHSNSGNLFRLALCPSVGSFLKYMDANKTAFRSVKLFSAAEAKANASWHNYNPSDLGPLSMLQPYTFKIFSWVRHCLDSYFGGSNHHSLFPPTVPQSDIQLPPHLKNDFIKWGDSTTNRCAVCIDMPPWTDILNESIFACAALHPAFLHPPTSTQFTATIELSPCSCSQRCFIDRLDQRDHNPNWPHKFSSIDWGRGADSLHENTSAVTDVALSATVTCGPKMEDSDKRVRKRNQEWDMSSLHSYWIKPMFFECANCGTTPAIFNSCFFWTLNTWARFKIKGVFQCFPWLNYIKFGNAAKN